MIKITIGLLVVLLLASVRLAPLAADQEAPTTGEVQLPTPTPTAAAEGRDSRYAVRVKDQLRPQGSDVELMPDGHRMIPDQGDGCIYVEVFRGTFLGEEEVVLQDPKCEAFFTLGLESNVIRGWVQ